MRRDLIVRLSFDDEAVPPEEIERVFRQLIELGAEIRPVDLSLILDSVRMLLTASFAT